jgi:uncharacterized Zn ribbon protein
MRTAILLTLAIALTFLSSPVSCRRESSKTSEPSENNTSSQPSEVAENSNLPNEGDPFAAIPRIKVDELARAIKEGDAVLVDIRVAEAYKEEHIKGAVSIPLEEIRERGPRELPADKLIVTYCA